MRKLIFAGAAIMALAIPSAAMAATLSTSSTDFESPFTTGDINQQQGWSKIGPYDVNVVSTGLPGLGQSMQLSNAYVDGNFGNQTFSPGVTPADGNSSRKHFEASFKIGTVNPNEQKDLAMSISPDNGSGGRMSYLRFEDKTDGVHVYFNDTIPGRAVTNDERFRSRDIATLSRETAHEVGFVMDLKPGSKADAVEITIDGKKVASGTSWKTYYLQETGESVPSVSKLIFRPYGADLDGNGTLDSVEVNRGKGFLIDDVTLKSS